MTALLSGTSDGVQAPGPRPPVLDVVVPVHNEEIASWVEQNFESQTVGDVTMYDLTLPLG
jgi:hypothetical protein